MFFSFYTPDLIGQRGRKVRSFHESFLGHLTRKYFFGGGVYVVDFLPDQRTENGAILNDWSYHHRYDASEKPGSSGVGD
jgi:hypothetical protein